ncbi:MAG: TatD family hydrolase [Candidatus Njordarchaeia archaeon]
MVDLALSLSSKADLDAVIDDLSKLDYVHAIDVHCHVDSDMYSDEERYKAINNAIKHRIEMITVPLSKIERERAIELKERFKGWIHIVTGSHPLIDEDIEEVIRFIIEHRDLIVGVGEIGLDFKPPNNTFEIMERQVKKFERFISLAKELDKPIVVHSRSAGRQSIDVLIRNGAERVLMHAFSGNVKYVRRGVQAGYFFSVPPTSYKNVQKINLIKAVPIEQLMLETDSPVLSPLPDTVNEPSNVLLSALIVAKVKDMDVRDVIEVTYRNATSFFRI